MSDERKPNWAPPKKWNAEFKEALIPLDPQEEPQTEGRFIPTKDDREIQWFPMPDGTAARLDPMDFEFAGFTASDESKIELIPQPESVFDGKSLTTHRLRPVSEVLSSLEAELEALKKENTRLHDENVDLREEVSSLGDALSACDRVEALHLTSLEAQSNLIKKKDEEIAELRSRLAQHEPPTTYLEPQYPGS